MERVHGSAAVAPQTLLDVGTRRLHTLCRALGYDAAQASSSGEIFRKLAVSWADRPAAGNPHRDSDITDDHTPFEFSVAIDGDAPELRFLLEVQGVAPSVLSDWEAGLAMNERLADEYGFSLQRFAAVQDLFAPTVECQRFALWHAVCFRRGASPDFKIYLNPQAKGADHARAVVESAMARLGMRDAFKHLSITERHQELCYFSLDLSSDPQARVKVYVAHHDATSAEVEDAVSKAAGHVPGRAARFCHAMGDSGGPFRRRPVLTCLTFVEGMSKPKNATVHFPVRSYAPHDGVVRDRVLGYLHEKGAPIYSRALKAFSAGRPLAESTGMQTYVSLRLDQARDRVTVYLAPNVYQDSQVEQSGYWVRQRPVDHPSNRPQIAVRSLSNRPANANGRKA
jgi:DMATS type aromatic prenyltransferase